MDDFLSGPETVAIIIYNDLNVYGMFKLSEYWTRVRCNVVHLLQGKEVRSLYVVFVHTKSLLKDGHSTGLRNLNPLSIARASPLFLHVRILR